MNKSKHSNFLMLRMPDRKMYSKDKYSPFEALSILQMDYYYRNKVTVQGYAKAWNWNERTVSKFVESNFIKIERSHKKKEGMLIMTDEGKRLGDASPIIDVRIDY